MASGTKLSLYGVDENSCKFRVKLSKKFNTDNYRKVIITQIDEYGNKTHKRIDRNESDYDGDAYAKRNNYSSYAEGTIEGLEPGKTYTFYAYAKPAVDDNWHLAGEATVTTKEVEKEVEKEVDLIIDEVLYRERGGSYKTLCNGVVFEKGKKYSFKVAVKNKNNFDSPEYKVVVENHRGETIDLDNEEAEANDTENAYLKVKMDGRITDELTFKIVNVDLESEEKATKTVDIRVVDQLPKALLIKSVTTGMPLIIGQDIEYEVEIENRGNNTVKDIDLVVAGDDIAEEQTITIRKIKGNTTKKEKVKLRITKTGYKHLDFDIYDGDKKLHYFDVNGKWENGEEFCNSIIEIAKKEGEDVVESLSSESLEILDEVIKCVGENQKESVIDKKDFANFAIVGTVFMKVINESLKFQDIDNTDKGVIGVVVDARTGGGLSLGGSIGIFVDATGNLSVLGTISGGSGTTDINLMPSITYYPTMPSVEELEGWGFSMDVSIGKISLDLVFSEHISLGIDLINIFVGKFKNLMLKDISAGVSFGNTWDLLSFDYDIDGLLEDVNHSVEDFIEGKYSIEKLLRDVGN